MGDDAFYMYTLIVVKKKMVILYEIVLLWRFRSFTNKNNVLCGINPEFNEIMWYYPSNSATLELLGLLFI
jgi:hypothetical protein